MKFAALSLLCLVSLSQAASSGYFAPEHRLAGIGVDRDGLADDALATRTRLMVDSQTFIIMREPKAVAGAKRVTGDPKLQAVFRAAAAASGFPQDVLEAIAYLESWGDVSAESWAGSPRGIMQISLATARTMGLKVGQVTRYRTVKVKVQVKSARGKVKYKTVRRRTPYTVLARDERLIPERAIPAAAQYLAGMERTFGSRDWAIFAYHCGQGCVARHGTGNSTSPSSSKCSATTRPLTISASCAPPNCWLCTVPTRPLSPRWPTRIRANSTASAARRIVLRCG